VVRDVTPIFVELLAENRSPDPSDPEHRQRPNYGVVATVAFDILEVELTFRSGSAYCCYEWGCHIALVDGKRWDGLRKRFEARGIIAPPRFNLRWKCVIEEGSLFFDFGKPDSKRRGWYGFTPSAARFYQAEAAEAPPK
jgi:hypothetical protein